jgi:RNA-directed DNA polymerase
VNTGAPQLLPSLEEAQVRVLGIQTKLHQWATGDPLRRFDDLYNLVCDPAFLLVAWHRVRGNKAPAPPGSTGVPPATSSGAMAWRGSSPTFGPS